MTITAITAISAPPPFTDHMVLQRDRPAPIWGAAPPGTALSIACALARTTATADADGRWRAELPALSAGGPHELVIEGAGLAPLRITDVLIGDVWLASGQSNMWWTVELSADPQREIQAAHHPRIRLFDVPQVGHAQPQARVDATWRACTPETVAAFSAVAYYFGRALQRDFDVPIGLIASSWGGTMAEPWMRRSALEGVPDFEAILARANRCSPYAQHSDEYRRLLKEWKLKVQNLDPGNQGEPRGWHRCELDSGEAGEWLGMLLPKVWQAIGLHMDGAMWFRCEVDLPVSWAGRALTLELGTISHTDTTYFNGVRIGGIGEEREDADCIARSYAVPAGIARASGNVIAVRVYSHLGYGGFSGSAGQMRLFPAGKPERAIPLAIEWRYRVEVSFEPKAEAMPIFAGHESLPQSLYNGMIHPLVPFGIRGVIWYQGESNADRGVQYRSLLAALIADWRAAWGQGDFPFLIVQIANFRERAADPGDGGWAELREAQERAAREVPNAALAVTIDIGDAGDVHPRNKQTVGERLALCASAVAYDKPTAHSGPRYAGMSVEGGAIRLRFSHVARGLVMLGKVEGFAIAGDDRKFVWGEARIDGDSVVVESHAVRAPVAVRYGWADNPPSPLYDGAGLPASPFRTDDWPVNSTDRR